MKINFNIIGYVENLSIKIMYNVQYSASNWISNFLTESILNLRFVPFYNSQVEILIWFCQRFSYRLKPLNVIILDKTKCINIKLVKTITGYFYSVLQKSNI